MKIGLEAMTAALEDFRTLNYTTRLASLYESYLTAKLMAANGSQTPPVINDCNKAVSEIFDLADGHPLGRLYPFRYDWKDPDSSGRKTVWNNTTRGPKLATSIFVGDDLRNGLRSDAAIMVAVALETRQRPSRQSLVCLVLHAHEFAPDATWATAEAELLVQLGMTATELEQVCSPAVLGGELFGPQEWSADALPDVLAPPASVQVAVPPVGGGVEGADPVVVDARTARMLRRSIERYQCVLLVGPPGTGKGRLLNWLVQLVAAGPESFGFAPDLVPNPMWRTPDESWSAFELIGGFVPEVQGWLRWSHGLVVNSLIEQRWLVLDETNRADMDKIMGPLLTWLARQEVEIGRTTPHQGFPVNLGWTDTPMSLAEDPHGAGESTRFLAGRDWRLLGTYNPQDAQRVFRFGLALSRRFVVVPIPALAVGQFDGLLRSKHPGLAEDEYLAIVGLYSAHRSSEETTLGPAVFLRMALYLDEASGAVRSGADPVDLVAEAYVVSAGKYLAAYDNHALQELGDRMVTDESALTQAQWGWVVGQRNVLG
jgi:hypothetical protein